MLAVDSAYEQAMSNLEWILGSEFSVATAQLNHAVEKVKSLSF